MKIIKILVVLGLALFIPTSVLAFEPKIVDFRVSYDVVEPNKDIGYFSKLMGDTMRFNIKYDEPRELDIALWIPDIWNATKNIQADVGYVDLEGRRQSEKLTMPENEWEFYHDDFTGNDYYKGPELHLSVSSGTQTVNISTKSNENSFLLILGDSKDASYDADWRGMLEWGKVKNDVYAEFPLKAYYNIYGLIALIPLVIFIAIVIYLGIWEYLSIKKKDQMLENQEKDPKDGNEADRENTFN